MKYNAKAIPIFLAIAVAAVLLENRVQAQSGTRTFGSNLSDQIAAQNSAARFTTSNINQQLRFNSVTVAQSPARPNLGSYSPPAGQSSKPFSSINRGPTVSPYLALNNSFDQVSSYYNIVRPQQEQRRLNQQQQRVNQRLQRQNYANQRRLNQMAARGPYNPQGDENLAPTGNVGVFQSLGTYLNTGTYYSGAPIPR